MMDQTLVLKNDVRNAILAAQRAALELVKRAPSSVEMEVFLDGFTTALEVIATGLGVEVDIERPFSTEPRLWREVWDTLPAKTFGGIVSAEQTDESNVLPSLAQES